MPNDPRTPRAIRVVPLVLLTALVAACNDLPTAPGRTPSSGTAAPERIELVLPNGPHGPDWPGRSDGVAPAPPVRPGGNRPLVLLADASDACDSTTKNG